MHHEAEVVVSVDRGRDVFVVVTELVECDDAISHLGVPERHELAEDVYRRFPASHYIRVLGRIVKLSNIV